MLLLNASRRLMSRQTVTDYKIDSVGMPPMEIAETLVSSRSASLRAQSPERQRRLLWKTIGLRACCRRC
ncbi:MAG: hypothetical protein ACLRTQ_06405 [Candidatus Borkfalkia sp.]